MLALILLGGLLGAILLFNSYLAPIIAASALFQYITHSVWIMGFIGFVMGLSGWLVIQIGSRGGSSDGGSLDD